MVREDPSLVNSSMSTDPKQRPSAFYVRARKKIRSRADRSFDRYYMGADGLRHVVPRYAVTAACGQTLLDAQLWGGGRFVTCLMCLGGLKR